MLSSDKTSIINQTILTTLEYINSNFSIKIPRCFKGSQENRSSKRRAFYELLNLSKHFLSTAISIKAGR